MFQLSDLSADQLNNLNFLLNESYDAGLTNPDFLASLASLAMKETRLIPTSENMNYSKERLPEVWGVFSKTGKRVKTGEGKNNYNQLAIQYANQPEKLGNYIYGGKNGNQINEGYKYRGRGYNGITFKNLYAVLSNKYGVDFINNPDAINQPKNSANSLIYYFTDLNNHFKPNDVTSLNDSITKTFRHNAGWGYGNPSESNEGYKKMLMYGPEFKKYVDAFIKKKSNPDYEIAPIYVQSGNKYPQLINILFLLGILGIGIYFVNKKRKLTS